MINIFELATDADWASLRQNIDPSGQNEAVTNIVAQLRAAGTLSALVEEDYLDRDFSDEFKAFYSTLFGRFRRHTRRLSFFRVDVSPFFAAGKTATEIAAALTDASENSHYLGFVIVRPVSDAPIGRTVLNVLSSPNGRHAKQHVRASYVTHVLGARLEVRDAVPFMQQDSRVSACAQASIWVAGRHFHAKHGGPWISTVAITDAASKPTDEQLASSLPAGAGGLSTSAMIRAIRAMDRHPLAFSREPSLVDGDWKWTWPSSLDPMAIVTRYVGSGLPVILCLASWNGSSVGHAVVATGSIFQQLTVGNFPRGKANFSEFIEHILVQDDQRGINLRVPHGPGVVGDTPYNIQDQLTCIIVPLPDKVFLTGEAAESIAWDQLGFYANSWPALRAAHAQGIGNSAARGDQIVAAFAANQVAARSYLTHGWKHKARLVASNVTEIVKGDFVRHELPRMIWVTEFSIIGEANHLDPTQRQIFGHSVSDATTSPFQQSFTLQSLALHLPGFLWLRSPAVPDFFPETDETVLEVPNDTPYCLRDT